MHYFKCLCNSIFKIYEDDAGIGLQPTTKEDLKMTNVILAKRRQISSNRDFRKNCLYVT